MQFLVPFGLVGPSLLTSQAQPNQKQDSLVLRSHRIPISDPTDLGLYSRNECYPLSMLDIGVDLIFLVTEKVCLIKLDEFCI